MRPQVVAGGQWTARRGRAAELEERWPFAAEVLAFYRALLDTQGQVYDMARSEVSDPSQTVSYAVARALPMVRAVTIASGPEKLARAVADLFSEGETVSAREWEEKVKRWLGAGELAAVDRYMARAAAGPVLEALGPAPEQACGGARDDRHCPRCGGLPQVSILAPAGEDLVAPRRYLECSRCAWRWAYPRMTCAACGETETRHLPIFAEVGTTEAEATGTAVRGLAAPAGTPVAGPRFRHISVYACRTCSRYLLNVDLSRDARAVPVVDEMAAIPLDLYAREQGVTKIVPNLMGL
jgi:Protein involved in formate dehydrogenase formation